MKQNIDSIRNLINLLADNHTLQEIVEEASSLLGNPLMLMDSTMNLLAVCGDDNIEDEIWNDFLAGNSRSKEYSDEKEVIHIMQTVMFENKPILTQFQDHQVNRIVSNVSSSGKILGYIVCLEHKNIFPENILELAQIVCDAFAIELQRSATKEIPDETNYTKVLREILKGKDGLNYSNKFLSTLFDHEKGLFFMVSIPFKKHSISASKITYLQQHIAKLSTFSFSVNLDNEIAILINTSEKKLHSIMQRYHSTLEVHNLKGGFSSAFTNIQEIYYYYQQARRAVSTGCLVEKQTIFYYPDFIMYDMLNTLAAHADIRQYRSLALSTLQQYDKKYGTDYLKTVEFYLKCSGNLTNMSKEMFTHRNTIVHRIQKIEEICKINLADHETRLELALSIKIDRLLQNKKS